MPDITPTEKKNEKYGKKEKTDLTMKLLLLTHHW